MTTWSERLDLRTRFSMAALGRCAGCCAHRAAPLCQDCLTASAVSPRPAAAQLAMHRLYFVGAYHAPAGGAAHALSPLGHALRSFKDHGDRYAGRCLARLFAERCAPFALAHDAIVPVPSDIARLRQRGFSPAAWLARTLSGCSGVPLLTRTLRRVPGSPPQRGLGGRSRRINARGAFALGPCSVEGYSIVLTDDVLTTGATLLDAARCLREAGAAEVVFFVLACADEEVIWKCRLRTATAGTNATAIPRR